MKTSPGKVNHIAIGVIAVVIGLCFSEAIAVAGEWQQKSDAYTLNPGPLVGDDSNVADRIENSVVKIFATQQAPDLAKPWSKQSGREITGSGLVIAGKRILTNAHVVSYAGQVQIQGAKSGDKISATVEAVAPGMDLAVLKLSDESFFSTHPPLVLAQTLPRVKETVMVYGFPTGGSSMSITKGIVSRVEFSQYSHSVSGLRVQIDAAINPGNSGGPAIVGDKVVGVAFSVLANAQNIGYIIPCDEVELFLADISDGHYDGKPALFDDFQTLENPALRSFLKLDQSVEGIIVSAPFQSDSGYPLRKWDVVTKIGDAAIDNQGNVTHQDDLRLPFASLVQKIAKNGKVPMTVLRGGKEMAVQVPVSSSRPKLIPYLQGRYPSYFICGPLVFSVVTEEILSALSSRTGNAAMINILSQSGSPLYARRGDRPAFKDEELVVVPSPLFAHALAKNYSSPILKVLVKVNGISVKNLRHLVEIIRDCRDEYITFEFAGLGSESIVFRYKDMLSATEEILNDNGIRSQASPDLLTIWSKKAH